jgi:hypothetical protein
MIVFLSKLVLVVGVAYCIAFSVWRPGNLLRDILNACVPLVFSDWWMELK